MTWYKAIDLGGCRIEPVEVEKIMKNFVVINGHRQAKDSDRVWYRPTWEEAKSALVEAKKKLMDEAQKQFDWAKARWLDATRIEHD